MENDDSAVKEEELPYEFVRPAETYETMFHLWHTLGIQSNILVGARYKNSASGGGLTKSVVFKALESVIADHPALGMVGISRESEKKKGNHRLWEARLKSVDLRDCVIFEEGVDLETELPRLIEEAHNNYAWFNTGDTTAPWWRLCIYNGSLALFVFHHAIGDGLSGYAFHRSFHAALNQTSTEPNAARADTEESAIVETSTKEPTPFMLTQLDDKLAWTPFIISFIWWTVVRLLINKKYFFFSDAKFSKGYPTIRKPFPERERSISEIQILRIDAFTMRRCISACRSNKTTFTALLHTLIKVTLATDIYPQARLGFSQTVVNLRHLCKNDPGLDVFANASGSYIYHQSLSKIRSAGQPCPEKGRSSPKKNEQSPNHDVVNSKAIWDLTVDFKRGLNKHMESRAVVQATVSGSRFLGNDDESVSDGFSGLGLFQNNSFSISNLGVFKKKTTGDWKIDDVVFSAGVTKASVAYTLAFNVCSMEDGDCVICAVYEPGVIKSDVTKMIFEGVAMRLDALLN